ncbi:hypothetical protein PV11_08777 [Exophiala sideris]|uniref:Uncharacterized protein n=1 Tax=Exophiala sideris TaxID=1016849 RepID=A0A0D1YPK5_9EURO|nr:hypothetical protein PV11_08777 [Exophiala sideris]
MSARLLTDGYLAQAVQNVRSPEPTDPRKLDKDQMRLYSFYKPSLQANTYLIQASQTITSYRWEDGKQVQQSLQISNAKASDTKGESAPQQFEVVVPRFSLDPNLINTYYPPDGHQDEGRILPHIVLNDPHYPWEIAAGTTQNLDGEIDRTTITNGGNTPKTFNRSIVPWVALLVFDPEELRLETIDDAVALQLPGFAVSTDLKRQNPNGTFSMAVSDYFNTIATSAQVNYAAAFDNDSDGFAEVTGSSDKVNIIFPTKRLIKDLFSTADATNFPDTPQHKNGIEQYKYLAHVREINTEGCPDAGSEQQGLFSVVISSRTGALRDSALQDNQWIELPTSLSQPRTQVCHLVSIENLDKTYDIWGDPRPKTDPAPAKTVDRIGLVSLFSWVYQALPRNPVNFVTTVRNLLEKQQMLRVDDTVLNQQDHLAAVSAGSTDTKSQVSNILANRLKMGYTLGRWRTQTGEETAAFNRGPLVPLLVPPHPAKNLPDCSTNSQDYQILDPQTGLMDLSYSSAWQLGKLLAISDTSFSAALMRFRSLVRNAAADITRKQLNNMTPSIQLSRSVQAVLAGVQKKTAGETGVPQRARAPTSRSVVADITDTAAWSTFMDNLTETVRASTGSAIIKKGDVRAPFNGFNLTGPSNSDWPVIHDWLAEKLSLGGIPPQYLVPEPSFLPPESLRFFYIDDFWLDCLLDGALSVANHLDADDDVVRREIKKQFNIYLDTVISEAGIKPQIPCSGFILRSKLIQAMPDLRITVTWVNPDTRYTVCRWTKWDDQTLMCLLDRRLEELASITLAQPQHQQRYAMGSAIDADEKSKSVTFSLRKIVNQKPGIYKDGGKTLDDSTTVNWLNFSTRRLNIQTMATAINQLLRDWDPNKTVFKTNYTDPTPNSCEFGIELGDPAYFFQIAPPPAVDTTQHFRDGEIIKDKNWTSNYDNFRNRQLFVRKDQEQSTSAPNQSGNPPATSASATPHAPTNHVSKLLATTPPTGPSNLPVSKQGRSVVPTNQRSQFPSLRPTNPSKNISPTASGNTSTSGLQRRFNLKVFADYKGPPLPSANDKFHPDNFVPTGNTYYFDLIFDLRKTQQSDYRLLKITIDIPIRTKDSPTDAEWEPLLTDKMTGTSDGSGLRMLSNQRFVPFLFSSTITSKGGKVIPVLHMEVVPRSTNFDYAIPLRDDTQNDQKDRKTAELSFRLANASIAVTGPNKSVVDIDGQGRQLLGKCTIFWTEWYATTAFPNGEAVPSGKCFVVKRDIKDPKEPPDVPVDK